ncbi:MAG: hypothetical protein ACJ8AK_10400 [Gemmatimonadaceae bacterium]
MVPVAGGGRREAGGVTASHLSLIIAFFAFAAASPIGAQASAYVPLDDIAYTYIDVLMARGQLSQLSVLERPFTQAAIRDAIDSARMNTGTSEMMRSYLDGLWYAVEKYAVRPRVSDTAQAKIFRARFTNDFYVTGQTSGRRELMLADLRNDVRPGGAIRLVMAGGPVVGFTRVLIDSRLNVDPEFAGRKDRKVAARTEDGYVGGQWTYGQLSFGRVGRNWGPPTQYGLQLGNYAYTYDHLYGLIGNDKIHWSAVIARLDDILPPTGPAIERYFTAHRLTVHLGQWELAGTESYVYGGVGRGFEPALANPFNIYALSWRNEQKEGNLGLGGEIAVRTARFGTLAGQLFIDDFQIDRSCNPACKQPSSYGMTLTAEGLPLRGDQRWFASYTRVSNLAYNNKNPDEHYEVFGLSLGRGFNDYDEARLGLDLALVARMPFKMYVAHRRQGEGDYHLPFPDPAAYATTPGIFSGVVMRVTRAGVSGASHWRDWELSGDLGVNHTTNYLHVVGETRTGFEGRVKIAIEPRWSVSF